MKNNINKFLYDSSVRDQIETKWLWIRKGRRNLRRKSALLCCSIALLAPFLSSCRTGIGYQQNQLVDVLDLARKTRPAPELIYHIVDYTTDNDMGKSIQSCLQRSVGQTFDESNIQRSKKGLPGGNPLFFVRDSEGNLKYIVKVFNLSAPRNTFAKELAGLQLASTIDSKGYRFVSAQAVGKCRIGNSRYGLLAISPPVGISLKDLASELFASKKNSVERAEALGNLRRAFEKLGASFAELHRTRTEKKRGIHPAILRYGRELLSAKPLTSKGYGIDPMLLQKYFYSLANRAEGAEIKRSFAHGDIILDNFIYDPKSDALTMVNLAFFSDSADQEGNPIQHAMFDYVGLVEQIESFRNSPDLTDKEYKGIKDAFTGAYGPPPGEGIGDEFFTLLYRLSIIFWTSEILKWKADSSEEVRSWLEPSLKNLRSILSTYQKSLSKTTVPKAPSRMTVPKARGKVSNSGKVSFGFETGAPTPPVPVRPPKGKLLGNK